MENEDQILATIRKKTHQRFLFAAVTLLLYGSFVLCYTESAWFLTETIGDSPVSGGLVLYLALIAIFLTMEYVFLSRNKD